MCIQIKPNLMDQGYYSSFIYNQHISLFYFSYLSLIPNRQTIQQIYFISHLFLSFFTLSHLFLSLQFIFQTKHIINLRSMVLTHHVEKEI